MKTTLGFAVLAVLAIPSFGIDYEDFAGFTNVWLCEADSNSEYNLYMEDDVNGTGIVNFHDFALFNAGVIKCPPCEEALENEILLAAAGVGDIKCCDRCLWSLQDTLYARITDTRFEPDRIYKGSIVANDYSGVYANRLDCAYPECGDDQIIFGVLFCKDKFGYMAMEVYGGNCECKVASVYKIHCYVPPYPYQVVVWDATNTCRYEISLWPFSDED